MKGSRILETKYKKPSINEAIASGISSLLFFITHSPRFISLARANF